MPFLAATTLQRALDAVQTGGYDSIVPVGRTRAYLWDPETGKPRYNLECLPNSFELPEIVFETMGLYIITAKAHRETGRRIGHHPFFLELSRMEQLDIDYPEDLELACCIDKGLPAENPCKLRAP